MIKKILLSIILIIASYISFANKVLISGKAKDYIGHEISVFAYNNHFIYTKTKLGSCVVDEKGYFKLYINIKDTQLISIPLDYFTGEIFVEPNKEYVIKLPTRRVLNKKEKLNPYFRPIELLLGVENTTKDELNYQIKTFDESLESFINKNNKKKSKQTRIEECNEFITRQTEKNNSSNSFLNNYIKYSLSSVEYIYNPQSVKKIELESFNNKKIHNYNPAYTSLYKKIYGNFLLGNFKRENNKVLTSALKSKNKFSEINKILKKYSQYSDPIFREMLVMTSIYDGYNRQLYPFETCLSIFEEIQTNTRNIFNKKLSKELIANITKLHPGYNAPNFTLGKYKLKDFTGKYLYINFSNTQSISCLQDFEEMSKLYKHFGKEIEFISICSDFDKIKYREFVNKKKYKWIFVQADTDNSIYRNYNVRAFPTYCLIDPNGKILKEHARSPKEQIEVDFSNILRVLTRKRHK